MANNTPQTTLDPFLLTCLQRIQALAQSGIAYCTSAYDRERYDELQSLTAAMMAASSGMDRLALDAAYAAQLGYATPKIDVRAAVFDSDKILMVREVQDHNRWTLPGGWADVGCQPSESIIKEVSEESGYIVEVDKLAALWDHRTHHPGPRSPFHIWKHFYLAHIVGGAPSISLETSEVAFFAEDQIPSDLSTARVTQAQIARMFAHNKTPSCPTEFD